MIRHLTVCDDGKGKGRAFRGVLLAHATADALWSGGGTGDAVRPAYAAVAASEGEVEPLLANLRLGRKATLREEGSNDRKPPEVEFLKSAAYRVSRQRFEEVGADGKRRVVGAVVELYLPDLFRLDPGMVDPAGVAFVALPRAADPSLARASEPALVERCLAHLRALGRLEDRAPPWRNSKAAVPDEATARALVPVAQHAAVMLSRRTRVPVPPDPRFHVQALVGLLAEGLASLGVEERGSSLEFGRNARLGYREVGTLEVGLAPGVAVWARHEDLERVLAQEAAAFYAVEERTR